MNYIKETLEYLSKLLQWWIIVMPWEQAIRVRAGKRTRILTEGTYFRIPFIDNVYVQTKSLRVLSMPMQTISTKDGKTLSLCSVIGYQIADIEILYKTLFQPDGTICNMAMAEVATFVSQTNLEDCGPEKIEQAVIQSLSSGAYGIKYEYVKVIGYAVVKTYRLIQDMHWTPDSLTLHNKS